MESRKYYVEYQPTITRELEKNYGCNEIFVINTNGSFGSLIRNLRDSEPNDILFVLDDRTVYNCIRNSVACDAKGDIIMQYDSPLAEQFFEHLVAVQFMIQLKARYAIPTTHDLDEELKYFTEKSVEEYLEHADSLVSREDVLDAIEGLNMDDTRIHIALRVSVPGLFKELCCYLQDEYPFITMLYVNSNMPVSRDGCKYRRFVFGQQVENTYSKSSTKRKSTQEQEKR